MNPGLQADKARSGAILEVKDLRTEFRQRRGSIAAVDGVSFTVFAGETVGLVGESGSGKSTIGLSIMRLLPGVGHITGGSISIGGRDLSSVSDRAMQRVRGNEIGMIFQDPMTALNPSWTIGRHVAEPVMVHNGVSKKHAMARALEVLELVGMPRPAERLSYYPHQLSGGLRQRVAIAMALACSPKLLIADEPTTALDVTIQAQILDLIDDLQDRLDMAVLLITHDMGVIAARSRRVMVMYAGRIVEEASTDSVFLATRHPYSEALMKSIPGFDQDPSKDLFSIPGRPPDLRKRQVGCRFSPRCTRASARCVEEDPALATSSDDAAHAFACFHPVSGTRSQPSEPAAAPALSVGASVATAPIGQQFGSPEPESVLMNVDHLFKEYPVTAGLVMRRRHDVVHAVSDVSLSVKRGETLGLVGESGCGKTTLGRMMVGLEQPTSGAVRLDGVALTSQRGGELRLRRRDVQLMFQDPYASLDPRMTVGTIIQEPLVSQSVGTRTDRRARVEELLSEVGLPGSAASLYPHEFSGGQRQRIGLARALALRPKLIVADEPVSALDVSIQAQILNLMRSLQKEYGLTYVIISHDLSVVKYLAATIGVMHLGEVIEVGPAEAVYSRAVHPYTQGLIDAIPPPDPVLARVRPAMPIRGELPSAVSPPSGCRFRTRCPSAAALCANVVPPLRLFGPDHWAACHFPLREPASDTPSQSSRL